MKNVDEISELSTIYRPFCYKCKRPLDYLIYRENIIIKLSFKGYDERGLPHYTGIDEGEGILSVECPHCGNYFLHSKGDYDIVKINGVEREIVLKREW